jgi:hypothetical protein
MINYPEHAADRDAALMRRLTQAADNLRMYLRNWITEEVKETRIELQIAEETASGVLKTSIQEKLRRLDEIERTLIWELDELVEGNIADVRAGDFTSPPEARIYMEEGVRGMEALVLELRLARAFLLEHRGETTVEN